MASEADRRTFRVEDFREPGDTDQEVIAKAVRAAEDAGGGTVRFAARTYEHEPSGGIDIPANVTLAGPDPSPSA